MADDVQSSPPAQRAGELGPEEFAKADVKLAQELEPQVLLSL
jgi:hypothetical protein